MKIDDISLKIIPDSRGKDTLEATFKSGNFSVTAAVPSGKSTGINEVFVLDPATAVEKFNDDVKDNIFLHDFSSVEQFDNFLINLDSTDNKKDLGGNLMLALSIGFTKLLAKSQNLEIYELIFQMFHIGGGTKITKLPLCFFNVINGGLHAKDSLPFQEYMFVPQNNKASESLNSVMMLLKTLGDKIQEKYSHLRMGDEGGYEVPSKDPEMGLKILTEVMQSSGQNNAKLSLDVAASSFYKRSLKAPLENSFSSSAYKRSLKAPLENSFSSSAYKDGLYLIGEKVYTQNQLLQSYEQLTESFKLLSIEDPFDEKDDEGFQKITEKIGRKTWIVGDDLTTTNPERIKLMENKKACNAVIIKPNQIGTVSETLKAVKLAQSYGWKIIVSHRSGETMDTFIADLAVGVGADGLKSGCPLQKERLVKYQRLIEIEKQLT